MVVYEGFITFQEDDGLIMKENTKDGYHWRPDHFFDRYIGSGKRIRVTIEELDDRGGN